MEGTTDLTTRREAMTAARSALAEVGSVLWQATGPELGPVLREIDDLGRLVEAARVAVLREALDRGEASSDRGPEEDGAAGLASVPTKKPDGTRLRGNEKTVAKKQALSARALADLDCWIADHLGVAAAA